MSTLIVDLTSFGIHPTSEINCSFTRDEIAVFINLDRAIPVIPTGILVSQALIGDIAISGADAVVAVALSDIPHAAATLIIIIYETPFFTIAEQERVRH